jgi:uncharacterized membrane protein YgaE (UPF0421/DUF939 family)
LKSEFWKIAGLSGDLKWIDDAALLNSISQAYFDIGVVAGWEVRLTDAAIGPGSALTMNFADFMLFSPDRRRIYVSTQL